MCYNIGNMKKNGLTIVVTIGVLVLLFIGITHDKSKQIARLRKEVDYAGKTYLVESGWTRMWGTNDSGTGYNLRSFDGGQNWYAVSNSPGFGTNDGGVIILGEADKIYPGLRKHLYDLDALIEHCAKHGALTLTNDAEIQMLENVGFTVKHK